MSKEIHLYLNNEYPEDTSTNFVDTGIAIRNCNKKNDGIVNTTQTSFISTRRFEEEYKVFVHFNINDFTEIMLGDTNERTKRIIKMGHNLENLILNGEFDQEQQQ